MKYGKHYHPQSRCEASFPIARVERKGAGQRKISGICLMNPCVVESKSGQWRVCSSSVTEKKKRGADDCCCHHKGELNTVSSQIAHSYHRGLRGRRRRSIVRNARTTCRIASALRFNTIGVGRNDQGTECEVKVPPCSRSDPDRSGFLNRMQCVRESTPHTASIPLARPGNPDRRDW